VIDDDDGYTHIGRQMSQQANIGIEASGRPPNAYYRKVFWFTVVFHVQLLLFDLQLTILRVGHG
jgi:hypothetical protein